MYRFQILVGLSGEVSGLVPITEAQVIENDGLVPMTEARLIERWASSDNRGPYEVSTPSYAHVQ